ncbi:hypothetical protein AB0B31_06725 [Catellatospora citrea]|uniref:hypothetical protein n=1 Tax=Catellatospora citrea TaxID=53366 RepID=UPI0033E81AC1
MLASILPGFRELRTPLAAGYLWILIAWTLLGSHLTRAGVGKSGPTYLMRLVVDYGGKPLVLTVVTFAAYLLGSVLEINPLKLWEHGGRPSWINKVLEKLRRAKRLNWLRVLPMSAQGQADVLDFAIHDHNLPGNDSSVSIAKTVMLEAQQLATRLQATNIDLFGRYDRLLAESSFRLNVAPPLIVLSMTMIWQSHIPVSVQLLLSMSVAALGAVLFRQAVARAIQSTDVIVQALVVGVVESRSLRRIGTPTDHASGSNASLSILDPGTRR